MPSTITHREFKLLLKPEKFPKRSALIEFNKLLEENAKKLKVRYVPSTHSTRNFVSYSSMIRPTNRSASAT
jgi:hypothetical protein